MKTKILLFIMLLFSVCAFSQETTDATIDKGSGILYFSAKPGTTPVQPDTYSVSEFAMNTAANPPELWVWNRTSAAWERQFAITQGTAVPTTAPATGLPRTYIRTTTGAIYVYNGSSWVELGAGGGGGGTDDQTAVEVPFTPTGNILSSDVQSMGEEIQTQVDAIQTLQGVSNGVNNLGVFSGTTITDNSTVKAALQELETGLEGVSGGGASSAEISDSIRSLENELNRIVNLPNDFTYKPPFEILYNYRTDKYEISSSFNLRQHANIKPVNTYYVNVNTGDDANDGLTWGNAVQSINQAITLANTAGVSSTINIAKGYYTKQYSWDNLVPSVALEVVGDLTQGVGDSIYITKDIRDEITGGWTASSNHYTTTLTTAPTKVIDDSGLDSYGHPRFLVQRNNSTEVDNNQGSWYYDSGANTLYVRQYDDTQPDANIQIIDGLVPNVRMRNNFKYYFKNLNLIGGGFIFDANDGDGGRGLYVENCHTSIGGNTIHGIDEAIIMNSRFFSTSGGDLLNYDAVSGTITKAVEFNIYGGNTTQENNTQTSAQASTGHTGIEIIRIQSLYENTNGDNVADVTGTIAYNVGCTFNNAVSAAQGGYFSGTGSGNIAYLDDCTFTNQSNYDINTSTGATVYKRNITESGAGNITTGTLVGDFDRAYTDSIYINRLVGIDSLSIDTTLSDATNRKLASALAIKTYVDNNSGGGGTSLPSGTNGQSLFYNASGELQAENIIFYDRTNTRIGIGVQSPESFFHIRNNVGNNYFKFETNASGADVGFKLEAGNGTTWTFARNNNMFNGAFIITAQSFLGGGGTKFVLSSTGLSLFRGNTEADTGVGLHLKGDIKIESDTAGDNGVILQSPDGTYWRVQIDNSGNLTTTSL